MSEQVHVSAPLSQDPKAQSRPVYEPPRVKVMSEREILNTFQLTHSMPGWWATGAC